MVGQSSADRAASVADLAAKPSASAAVPLILEGQSDPAIYRPILHQIMAGVPPPNRATAAQVDKVLGLPTAKLEAALLSDIQTSKQLAPGATTSLDGFQGESLINQL